LLQKTDFEQVKPVIFGCAGETFSDAEKAFFATEKPFGLILFRRNVKTPSQVKALCRHFRELVGRSNAPVLMDQEGGRVQRLRPPSWFAAPPLAVFGKIYDIDPQKGRRAAQLATQIIAADLISVGINVNCSPCLDMSRDETSDVIGDRALHKSPAIIAELGRVIAEAYLQCGIMPVVKHMPGHGRGTVDSHHQLPTVSAVLDQMIDTDFTPFRDLADLPWGMTAHIVFDQIDPSAPATQSTTIVEKIIRQEIGFDGLLLSDDLNMNALQGSVGNRAERAFEAGLDIVLHCSGDLDEMVQVAEICPQMTAKTHSRIVVGEQILQQQSKSNTDLISLKQELTSLLSLI
jgi:beta-N-acetylhexosaminidase